MRILAYRVSKSGGHLIGTQNDTPPTYYSMVYYGYMIVWYIYGYSIVWSPRAPSVPLLRALWSLFNGIWGVLKGSWGVLDDRIPNINTSN